MADREFRVLLSGDSSTLVTASGTATKALRDTGAAADDVATKTGHATTASSGMTREIIVLAHELSQGQYKRFGGSLLVLAEYSKSATAALSYLVGPLGAVAAAVGLLGLAVVSGSHDQEELRKSLVLTGNAAGVTADSFNASAKQIAEDTHSTIGAAKTALQELVSSGAFGPDLIKPAGDAVLLLAHLTGQSSEEIVKDFANMRDGVAEWAAKHNEQWHFLTAAQYEYIVALEKQGKTEEAERVTLTALYDHLGGNAVQQLGYLQRAWEGVKGAISGAWDALKNIGKADTVGESIAKLQTEIARRQGNPNMNDAAGQVGTAKLQALLDKLQAQQKAENTKASTQAQTAENNVKGVAAAAFLKRLDEQKKGLTRVDEALNEYYAQLANYKADGGTRSDSQIASDVAAIKKRFTDHKAVTDAISIGKEQFKTNIDGVKAFVAQEADLYKSREDALRRTRSTDLIGDQAYLSGLTVAQNEYLADLTKAQADEERLISARRAKADPREKAELDRLLVDSRVKYANTVRDTTRQTENAYIQADETAAAWARNQAQTNRQLSANLITDTSARATAIAAIDIAEKERQVSLLIEGTDARRKAEDALADYIVLRNRQLTEDLKPEWQKMLEGFQDTVAYMRKASDEFNTGFINGGRDAFVSFVTTGKLSVANLVGFIEQQFAKMVYDKYLAQYASDLGSTIFSGIANIVGGASYSANGGVGYSSAAGISGGRAAGGPVDAGATYLVGEEGPELLRMGRQSGTVVPNKALQSGDAINLTIAPTFNGGVTRNDLMNGMSAAVDVALAKFADLRRRGSPSFASGR